MAHKAVLNEMLKKSSEKAAMLDVAGQPKVVVSGTIVNESGTTLSLHEAHTWSGSGAPYPCPYPTPILDDDAGEFMIEVDELPLGSKAAVVYANTSGCAWLLAWHVPMPDNSYTNKVYVEVGNIAKYRRGEICWDDIERKLDASGASSHFKDHETGCEAFALIEGGNVSITGLAALFLGNSILSA